MVIVAFGGRRNDPPLDRAASPPKPRQSCCWRRGRPPWWGGVSRPTGRCPEERGTRTEGRPGRGTRRTAKPSAAANPELPLLGRHPRAAGNRRRRRRTRQEARHWREARSGMEDHPDRSRCRPVQRPERDRGPIARWSPARSQCEESSPPSRRRNTSHLLTG
jgi:hypothetical protein